MVQQGAALRHLGAAAARRPAVLGRRARGPRAGRPDGLRRRQLRLCAQRALRRRGRRSLGPRQRGRVRRPAAHVGDHRLVGALRGGVRRGRRRRARRDRDGARAAACRSHTRCRRSASRSASGSACAPTVSPRTSTRRCSRCWRSRTGRFARSRSSSPSAWCSGRWPRGCAVSSRTSSTRRNRTAARVCTRSSTISATRAWRRFIIAVLLPLEVGAFGGALIACDGGVGPMALRRLVPDLRDLQDRQRPFPRDRLSAARPALSAVRRGELLQSVGPARARAGRRPSGSPLPAPGSGIRAALSAAPSQLELRRLRLGARPRYASSEPGSLPPVPVENPDLRKRRAQPFEQTVVPGERLRRDRRVVDAEVPHRRWAARGPRGPATGSPRSARLGRARRSRRAPPGRARRPRRGERRRPARHRRGPAASPTRRRSRPAPADRTAARSAECSYSAGRFGVACGALFSGVNTGPSSSIANSSSRSRSTTTSQSSQNTSRSGAARISSGQIQSGQMRLPGLASGA